MTGFETPFPIRGTVTVESYGSSARLDAESEWVSETPDGNYLDKAVKEIGYRYGEGVPCEVEFTEHHTEPTCGGYRVLGPVEEVADE